MSKFSSSEKLNRSLDRANERRAAVDSFVNNKIIELSKEYATKYGDPSGNPAGVHAYMAGYLQSVLGTVAQCESIAEMRRTLRYSGINV
jgi:hypothetical protein